MSLQDNRIDRDASISYMQHAAQLNYRIVGFAAAVIVTLEYMQYSLTAMYITAMHSVHTAKLTIMGRSLKRMWFRMAYKISFLVEGPLFACPSVNRSTDATFAFLPLLLVTCCIPTTTSTSALYSLTGHSANTYTTLPHVQAHAGQEVYTKHKH